MAVYLLSTSTLQEDPRVAHHGAGPEPLVLQRRHLGQQAVQSVGHVQRPALVQNVVDGVSGLKAAFHDRHVPLRVQEAEDVFPFNGTHGTLGLDM